MPKRPRLLTASDCGVSVPWGVAIPRLTEYDLIVVWSSGGKDSQEALREAVVWATMLGVLDRVVVAHNDMGDMEFPGTLDLARRQAAHYGLPFYVVTRSDEMDLLDGIAKRGMFPSSKARYCTSDWKRGPGRTLLTRLVRELALGRPAKVLQVYGFRAAESSSRAAKVPFAYNKPASGEGTVRQVDDWFPIHHRSDEEVWAGIHASGVPYHWAYARGMRRLSCSFCVLATEGDLLLAARLRPRLFRRYVGVEESTGHAFQMSGGKKNPKPKPLGRLADLVDEDNAPCELCSAGFDEGTAPFLVHSMPDVAAKAMFGRTGLLCTGLAIIDARTGKPASPFWELPA